MKESITKFDLESAFKALDEIDVPAAEPGIRANRPALTEIFSRKSKFDCLMEEYYDINGNDGLEDAKAARDAEIAAAKLARIEKIVDLDAESAEDLLTSYVGKFIIQCPQCMTLFYKNEEDVEASEEDPTTVNVNEICQHCGNESGYTLIGKVGEATPEVEETTADEIELEDVETVETDVVGDEETTEETSDETGEETSEDEDLNFDAELEAVELEDEAAAEESEEDEEKKEESFSTTFGQSLNEELIESTDLDVSADEFEQLINSSEFKKPISDRAVRAMLNMEESVKEGPLEEASAVATEYELAFEPTADMQDEDLTNTVCSLLSQVNVKYQSAKKRAGKYYFTILGSDEDAHKAKIAIENGGFFKTWLTEEAAPEAVAETSLEQTTKKEESLDSIFDEVDELQEADLEYMISNSLVEMYGNVAGFRLKECAYEDGKFIVEGVIHFTSGNMRNTTYTFNEALVEPDKLTLRGLNEKLGSDKQFFIVGRTENKTLITESFKVAKN